jgi:hypothetical protein
MRSSAATRIQPQLVDQRRRGVAGPFSGDTIDVLTTATGERGEARRPATPPQ